MIPLVPIEGQKIIFCEAIYLEQASRFAKFRKIVNMGVIKSREEEEVDVNGQFSRNVVAIGGVEGCYEHQVILFVDPIFCVELERAEFRDRNDHLNKLNLI